jgi:hypothetical protein
MAENFYKQAITQIGLNKHDETIKVGERSSYECIFFFSIGNR